MRVDEVHFAFPKHQFEIPRYKDICEKSWTMDPFDIYQGPVYVNTLTSNMFVILCTDYYVESKAGQVLAQRLDNPRWPTHASCNG